MTQKLLVLLAGLAWIAPQEARPRLNVLFIAVDDLGTHLGCYGNSVVKSPNIDAIGGRGTVFERAYCQYSVCSPSRSSLMTGRRPDSTRVYDLDTHFRTALPDVVALPELFKKHGYATQSFGKVYHGRVDDVPSWSFSQQNVRKPGYGPEGQAILSKLEEAAKAKGLDLTKRENRPAGLAFEAPEMDDSDLPDGAIADLAIQALRTLKDRPFFLATGFIKPHLPFVAPKKYWDLYDEARLTPASNGQLPQDAPVYCITQSQELRGYVGIPKEGPISDELTRKLIHAYYACVSYVDAQIGRLLTEIDRLGLRENTVVVLWGDHGFHLGEHGMWAKLANFEESTRAPLLISVPGQKAAGRKSKALVEFVDVYPSLAEVCDLPLPAGLEGTSFAPLLDDPLRPWKQAAFSQCLRGIPGKGRCMGYTIRTDRWRLVEWAAPEKNFVQHELYDHENDPGENVNLAGRPEHAVTVRELASRLKAGWRAAFPSK